MTPMTPSQAEWERFYSFRAKVQAAVRIALQDACFCKGSEGLFELTLVWPDVFQDEHSALHGQEGSKPKYNLRFYCTVVGPRHKNEWDGETLTAVLDAAEQDLSRWL